VLVALATSVAALGAPPEDLSWKVKQSPPQAGSLPLKPPQSDAAIIRAILDKVGLIRGFGPYETTATVNRLRWGGDGQMYEAGTTYKVTHYDCGVSLLQAAERADITRTAPNGQSGRIIQVVASDKAWNERTPGVPIGWANAEARSRRLALWRTPFGIAKQIALATPGQIKIKQSKDQPIRLNLAVEGVETIVLLDSDYRPWRVEQKVAGHRMVNQYGDYRDLTEYGLMYATHIVETVDGKPRLDLRIRDADTASYQVFPPPASDP
jgi:hypothetical protein